MTISETGPRQYSIDVAIVVHAKQYRARKKKFSGSYKAAEAEYWRMRHELERKAKEEDRRHGKKMATLGDLVTAYLEVNTPSNPSYYRRIETDCAGYQLQPFDVLKAYLTGGENRQTGKVSQGYVQLLDKMNRRINKGNQVVEISKKLSNNAKNKTINALWTVCQWGYEHDHLPDNPMKAVKKWTREPARNVELKADHATKLFNTIAEKAPHYLPHILHLSKNPCRISDLRNMTADQLNMTTWQISFISGKKKVPATHYVFPEVRDFLKNRPNDCPWLFRVDLPDGSWRQLGDMKKTWAAIRKAAGRPDLRIHDLRHIACTWMDAQGASLREIMATGGWKSRQSVEVYHNIEHKAAAASWASKVEKTDGHDTEAEEGKTVRFAAQS